MEADLVSREGLAFEAIPAAGLHGVGLRALPGNLARLARGFLAARSMIERFKPDVLFFTGGYVGVPVALAGGGIPKAIFVPDIEPGLALRLIGRLADLITVSTGEARAYHPAGRRLQVTGYPTRRSLRQFDRASGREALGLDPERPVVLIFGGSHGARSINLALMGCLPSLLGETQIVHVSGRLDWPQVEANRRQLPSELQADYHAFPYLHERMGAALAAADLAVSRAGASAIGEFPLFGLPAVLVPYPHAWRYQKVNAAYLVSHGAAILLKDEDCSRELRPTISGMLADRRRLAAMSEAAIRLAEPEAADRIARALLELAGQRGVSR
jgi:UDP-N-acetylglucosamine--N-acetylmuramyl-(pentapeptide) pyrophosphoryl-undecaprenol N-acetylglucosamine transferase